MSEFNEWTTVIPTPTQVLYPLKAVLRTVVQYLLGLATTKLVLILPAWEFVWSENSVIIIDWVTNILVALFMALWAWVMSKPVVNGWLTKIGLGAQPKRAVTVVE